MRYVGWGILVVGVSLTCSCHTMASKTPAEVATDFFTQCTTGEYSKAEKDMTADFQKAVHGEALAMNGGMQTVCNDLTANGQEITMKVVSVEEKGETARVNTKSLIRNGTSTPIDSFYELVKENGTWKMTTNGH